MKTLSVVIPVYNEERTLQTLLDRVWQVRLHSGTALEILVVNDGSTDRSPDLIREWLQLHPETPGKRAVLLEKSNGGKGSAVKLGIAHSTGDVLIVQDADLEYDPEDYNVCIEPILNGSVKVVYGSREDSNRNRIYSAPSFYLGALSLTCWIDLLFNANLTDEPTCYKTFDGDLIRSIPLEGDRFEWEPEVTAKLLRLGFEIREVPIAYHPRRISEGKKIKFRDGMEGLWTALKWRFRSVRDLAERVGAVSPQNRETIRAVSHAYFALFSVTFLAILIRLIYALPGLNNHSLLMRPDSASYLIPAWNLLHHGVFSDTSQLIPTAGRPPLYPLFLTLFSGSPETLSGAIAASCILGGAIAGIVYLAARLYGSWKPALAAGLLFALNPTSIALSPMFLSDTLFTFFIACSLLFLLKFIKSHFAMFFMGSVFFAALGALTRPVNLPWILPCLILLFCLRKLPLHLKVSYALWGLLIFAAVLAPWIGRNIGIGAGPRLDTNSANTALHNAAALESSLTGIPGETLRIRYESECQEEFQAHPERYATPDSQNTYRERRMLSILSAHPWHYLKLCLRPYVLFPDLPSFLENLGITQTGRGTFDVLNRQGVRAAVTHYFQGRPDLLILAPPLVLTAFLTYLGAAVSLLVLLMRKQFHFILVFLLFAVYYLILPGPIAMPRYQLPALPYLCILCAMLLPEISAWRRLTFRRGNSTLRHETNE